MSRDQQSLRRLYALCAAARGLDAEQAAALESQVPDLVAAPAWCAPGVSRPSSVPQLSPAVVDLTAAVDALAEGRLSGRADEVAAVLVQVERLRGVGVRALGELVATEGHRDHDVPTASAWLSRTLRIGHDAARAAVRLAERAADDLEAVAAQVTDGVATLEHLAAAAAGTAGLDPELVDGAAEAIRELVAAAEPPVVRRQLRERAEAVDPSLGRDAARRQQARRGFSASALDGVGVALGGTLDDEDGAVLLHGLDLEVEAGRASGDTRGLAARRADVLVTWAQRALAERCGPGDSLAQDVHTVRTHLLVTCTPEQLRADADAQARGALAGPQALAVLRGHAPSTPALLPTGAPLLPEALRRLACDATLTLVLARPAGPAAPRVEPLYVGRSSRTVTGRQFAALVVRDRTCVVRGCTARPAACAAHHVRHWIDGGATDLDNLVLLCQRHHHEHHDQGHDLPHRDGRTLTEDGWGPAPPDG